MPLITGGCLRIVIRRALPFPVHCTPRETPHRDCRSPERVTSSTPHAAPGRHAAAAQPRRARRLPERGHPRVVLAVILVAQLMVMLDMSIVNVALPQIQPALDFTPSGPVLGAQRLHASPSAGCCCSARGPATCSAAAAASSAGVGAVHRSPRSLGGLATSPALLLVARGPRRASAAR